MRTTVPEASIRPVRRKDVEAVGRLVQLYLYDLGGERWGVNADGTFGSPAWHRRFWAGRGKHHFVVLVSGRLAGFVLVGDRAHFAGRGVREISEFFVLRKYRRRGLGSHAARTVFARFPGRWEVAELTWNVPAQRFWRGLIRACAVGDVTERRRRHGDLHFFVQHFATRPDLDEGVTAGEGRKGGGSRRRRPTR
jgi:predicted acetyltransferase